MISKMNAMIDSAYSEFNTLQEKIQKLESQMNIPRNLHLEYEDLKEEHYKVSTEFEEQKEKYEAAVKANKELEEVLTETESKLKEANFQRQQLRKKVAYLEELNNDM